MLNWRGFGALARLGVAEPASRSQPGDSSGMVPQWPCLCGLTRPEGYRVGRRARRKAKIADSMSVEHVLGLSQARPVNLPDHFGKPQSGGREAVAFRSAWRQPADPGSGQPSEPGGPMARAKSLSERPAKIREPPVRQRSSRGQHWWRRSQKPSKDGGLYRFLRRAEIPLT